MTNGSAEKTENQGSLTPICIAVYLALHAIWIEATSGEYNLVYLRVGFLFSVGLLLLCRRRAQEIIPYFFGRFLPSIELFSALLIVAGVIALRIVVELWNNYPPMDGTKIFIDDCIIAPINEEIVFRGVFMAVLLQQMPRHPYAAIWIGTLIFVSTHNLHVHAIVSLVLLGWLLGWIYYCGRSVPFCILCHFLWNAIPFIPLPFMRS
jgi:membrane protease YdiL (CAAX protease family)